MSPFIFVLAADLLQSTINDAMRKNLLRHPLHPNTDSDFPVIQYADDKLIIILACTNQVTVMKNILADYVASIGLHINFHKSTIVPINTASDLCQSIADIFGCKIASMPFTYLGLPLGTTKPMVLDLNPLVCRAERQITATMLLMSHASKLALCNSLITSLAIFTMGTL